MEPQQEKACGTIRSLRIAYGADIFRKNEPMGKKGLRLFESTLPHGERPPFFPPPRH